MNKKIISFVMVALVAGAAVALIIVRNFDKLTGSPTLVKPTVVSEIPAGSDIDPVGTSASDIPSVQINNVDDARTVISDFASDNGLTLADYPEDMVNLLARNPETLDYVLNFPLHAPEADPDIDLTGEVSRVQIPRLYQWDMRWGYKIYGSGPMGLTGCGPTCLSMVAIYLLGNTDMNPAWMADYAMNNGYYDYEDNSGTYWSLMTDGAYGLGIDVVEITTEEDRMKRNLDVGNPIIAIVGEGQFTDGGHFIVITGYTDEGFTINDPNSIANSERIWSFEELEQEVITLWVFRIL